MAMTTCRECAAAVSDEARKCPSCGVAAPTTAAAKRANAQRIVIQLVITAVVVVLAIVLVDLIVKAQTDDDFRSSGLSEVGSTVEAWTTS